MASNADIYRRMIDLVWNEGRYDLADEFFSADYQGSDPTFPRKGVAGAVEAFKHFHALITPSRYVVLHTVEEGDWISARWVVEGNFYGPMLGIRGSGQKIKVPGLSMNRFVGGKIVEGYISTDYLSLFKQLGMGTFEGVKL